ncbi:MAG: hypothetical protein AB7O98_00720 [Hyphomonadaceae bacterium]
MLEDRPILKDRLIATAVFSGIAIAAVAGFELILGGVLPTPGLALPEARRTDSQYVQVIEQPWFADSGRTTPVSYMPMLPLDEAQRDEGETDLAGGMDDAAAPDASAISQDDLYREIAALYAEEPGPIAPEPVAYAEVLSAEMTPLPGDFESAFEEQDALLYAPKPELGIY